MTKNVAILLDPTDNVATALQDLKAGDTITVQWESAGAGAGAEADAVTYTVVLREDIAFGHKYALRDIAKGTEVLKYGLPIGQALEDIRAGDWVHVHNCRSEHFGFRHEKYGIRA